MGNADVLNKCYLMLEYYCSSTSDVYLKPAPFMLEYVQWNDGSDSV